MALDVPEFKLPQAGAVAVEHRRLGLWRNLVARPAGLVPVLVLILIVLSAVFAPLIAPYANDELAAGPARSGPVSGHWFGTDALGRDLLSRTMYAGQLALRVTVVATAIAMVVGTIWGGLAAIAGRWIDEVLMRIIDATIAIPFLLLALILVAAFGASVASLTVVLGIVFIPVTARVARTAFLTELHLDYVRAARGYGTRWPRLLFKELLPNVLPVLITHASVVAASVLLAEAALSFLGVGVQPPDASWGTLILDGYRTINSTPSAIVFPGAVVFVTVWALTSIGDQVQGLLDPRRDAARA